MKKFLLSIFAVMLAVFSVQAEEVSGTITFKTSSSDSSSAATTSNFVTGQVKENGGFTLKCTATSYCYTGKSGLKMSSSSKNGTFTLGLGGTYNVKSITVNALRWKSSEAATIKVNSSSAKSLTDTAKDYVFEVNSEISQIKLDVTKRVYICSVTIIYEVAGEGGEDDVETVATPTFNPASGATFTDNLQVKISTTTEGATIYYTLNGGEKQSAPSPVTVNITETTTIAAYAIKADCEDSEEITAKYTKVTPISIAAARKACTAEGAQVVMDLSGAQVVGVGGSNVFVQKDGVGICLYKSNPTYKAGGVFANGSYVSGVAKLYNGLHEITDYTVTTSGVTTTEIEKNVVSIADVTVDNSCTYVTFENVTFEGGNIVSGEYKLAYYDTFKYIDGSKLPTTPCTVTGVLSVYNGLQILPLEIAAGPAQLPALSVEGAESANEAVEVFLNSPLVITPVDGSTVTYTMGTNEAVEIDSETEALFDCEGVVALTVVAEQKFYTSSEKTYYYNVVESTVPCTVSFSVNGEVVGAETVNLGSLLETAPEVSAPEGLEFLGWTEDEEAMDVVEFPYLVNENVTLYAVYSVIAASSTSWNLVEDADDINAGDEIIIAAANKNTALGAMSGKYHTAVDVVQSNDKKVLTNIGKAKVLNVGKNGDYYTFSYDSNYLYWTSENTLQTAKTVDKKSSWTIEISNGIAEISNANTSARLLQYNASSPRFACYTGTQQNLRIYKKTAVVVTTIKYHTLSVSAAGWATLYLDFAAAIPAEVEAYTVTEVNNGYVTLTQVEGVLPANTGIIVKADEDDYNFVASTGAAADVTGNLLSGTTKDTVIENAAYVLGIKDGIVGLYTATTNGYAEGTFLNNANKAYLPKSAGMNAASYSFRFGEGTTGINEVKGENAEVKAIYDLTGRRVEAITAPGIYIVGGKKVLVK